MSLRSRWLNFIMHLTSTIAERKQDLAQYHAVKSFFDVVSVVLLEGVLAIVSIPLYFSMKIESLSPENEFNVQYVIRKTLTFTFFFLLLLVFVVKTVVISQIVMAGGQTAPEQNRISLPSQQIFNYLSASVDSTAAPPEILKVADTSGQKNFSVQGTSKPLETIIVHVTQQKEFNPVTQIYTTQADNNGIWRLSSTQLFNKTSGDYSVRAQSYDPSSQQKSPYSPAMEYRFVPSWEEQALGFLDLLANTLLASFVAIGFFVVFLTF